jgi:hypothetical protein
VIIDLSDSGARISWPVAAAARHFTLALFEDGSVQRECEVVWTNGRFVGVKFVSGWYTAAKQTRRSSAHLAPRTGDVITRKPATVG